MTDETPEEKNTSATADFFARMGTLGELMRFLWKRKLYWLMPMIVFMAILIVLVVASGTGLTQWLYPLF